MPVVTPLDSIVAVRGCLIIFPAPVYVSRAVGVVVVVVYPLETELWRRRRRRLRREASGGAHGRLFGKVRTTVWWSPYTAPYPGVVTGKHHRGISGHRTIEC